MTTFFSDTFGGAAGTIQGRTPDVTIGSAKWVDGYLISTDGADAYFSGGSDPSVGGYASCGIGANPYGYSSNTPGVGALRTTFTTGSSVAVTPEGHRGVALTFDRYRPAGYGAQVTAWVHANPGASWIIEVLDAEDVVLLSAPVSVLSNTTYTLAIAFDESGYSAEFDGVSYPGTLAAPGETISAVRLNSIGATIKINSIELLSSLVPDPGFAEINISAPPAVIYSVTPGKASSSITAPRATLKSFCGATASITAPSQTLLSTGRNSAGENDFTYTAPSALLSAWGGANARLTAPGPALSTTATFVGWGKAGVSAPSATLVSSGTVSGTGQAALTLSTPYKLVGYSGAVASITLTGGYTVQATSTAGSIGGAAITCPLFELSASGTAQNYGSANLLAPAARLGAQAQAWLAAPSATLTAIGSAVITATYEAYVVNLGHRNPDATDETTRYTNFPFTHVVRYKNSYYGANSTGLYLLDGTTDNGAPIPWAIKTAITDFDSTREKTVASVYLSGRLGPEATITLQPGEDAANTYSFTTPRAATIRNHRQKLGRGLDARYFALGVSGDDTMELDGIEFNVQQKTRRI